MNLKLLILFSVSLSLLVVIPTTAFAEEPYVLSHFSAKSKVVHDDQLANRVYWTLIDGDKGTIVSSSIFGINVIRLSMTQSDSCDDSLDVVCLDGIITSIKNSRNVVPGDTLSMVFQLPEKQSVSITSGKLSSIDVQLDILKLDAKNELDVMVKQVNQKDESDPLLGVWASKIDNASEILESPLVHNLLDTSNSNFDNFDDIQLLIAEREEKWVTSESHVKTNTMKEVMDNEASELFANMVMFSKELNEGLLQEIILTNAHGANVAMSQRTTDYDQSDEEWWYLARDRGVYFGTPEFDESTQVDSWTMSLRITNSDNRFMGVIKFVVNDESKEKEIDSCELKPDVGLCKGNIIRYYFDETTNSCQEFIWGGCGGVVPFDTLSRCQMLCDFEK
jgi:hypothetical protein